MLTKRSTKLLFALTMCLLGSLTAQAGVIYSNGDVDLTVNASTVPAADNFVLQAGANIIRDVHWYGINSSFGIDPGSEFTVRIFADDGLGGPATDFDDPLYQTIVTASRLATSIIGPAGFPVYEYSAIVTPFTATPGNNYHLSVQNTAGDWAWSFDGAFFNEASQWTGSSWSTLTATRFAFSLTDDIPAVPEPATLALFGLGLTGIAASRRRRKA